MHRSGHPRDHASQFCRSFTTTTLSPPQEVADLMLRCLSTNPGARPTATQLVVQLEALVHFGATPAPVPPCPAP